MTTENFVETIRTARAAGKTSINATLTTAYRGCKHVTLLIAGQCSGNQHDVWIRSTRGGKGLGRAYLGSKRMAQNLEGWQDRIAEFC